MHDLVGRKTAKDQPVAAQLVLLNVSHMHLSCGYATQEAQHGIGLIDCEDPALTCQEEKNANWMVSLHTCIFDRWLMR